MQITQTQLSEMRRRDLSVVDTVIIHHSVFPKNADISEIDAFEQRPPLSAICVGYHAYAKCIDIDRDHWVMQMGRPIDCVPAAALGDNTRSYDICIGGNYHPGGAPFLDKPTAGALFVVKDQILQAKKKLPNLKYLAGHRDVALWTALLASEGLTPADVATACPGDLLYAVLGILRQQTGLAVHP